MSEAAAMDAPAEPGLHLPPRPYPGLRPFDPAEWPIYFGREGMVDELLDRLIAQRLVFVHGDSGCGKSSLVRAGLFAQLTQGRAGPGWTTAIALPRRAPLWNLAEALARLASGQPDMPADTDAVLPWRRALNQGQEAAAALAGLWQAAQPDRSRGCLLIDQFEELFQHAQREGDAEARLMAEVLMGWQANPPPGLYLVTTMRSEYLGACARFGHLAQTVNATQYLLPPMGHADLLRAVREPAQLYGGEVTRELATRLVADAGGSQDQLPLMQHTLMRLHALHAAPLAAQGQAWRLDASHFPAQGGCAGLLSAHADEVSAEVARGLPPDPKGGPSRLVEDLMRALTDTNAEGHAIRRPMRLQELADSTGFPLDTLGTVVDALRADGVNFLTPPSSRPLHPDTLVDIGHEALIRCWQALADPADGWLAREFRNGLVWRSLLVQADSFQRDPTNVLAPTTTDERLAWMKRRNAAWARRHGGGWERVQALLQASAVARDAERAEALESLARKRRLIALSLVTVVLVLGSAAWIWAINQQKNLHEDNARLAQAQAAQERKEKEAALQAVAALSASRDTNETLQAQLKAEQARGLMLAKDLESTRTELTHLREGLLQSAQRFQGTQPELSRQLTAMAGKIGTEAGRIDQAAATAAAPVKAAAAERPSATAARLYIHITSEAQRPAAERLAKTLAGFNLGGQKLVVPGVDLVKVGVSRGALRCFQASECKGEAQELLGLLRKLVVYPSVGLEDLSLRYQGSTAIRPRHYELWLPPGDLKAG